MKHKIAIPLVASLVGGFIGSAFFDAGKKLLEPKSLQQIAAEASAATVIVTITRPATKNELLLELPPIFHGIGSGFFVDNRGDVATCYHVVNDENGGETIAVVLADGPHDATIVYSDKKRDIAILHINGESKHQPVLTFANSSEIMPADQIVAVGNPFGLGLAPVFGRVSVVSVVNDEVAAGTGEHDPNPYIKGNIDFNHGNSGGPVVTENGVIGMAHTMISSVDSSAGIAQITPSNAILEDLRAYQATLGDNIALRPSPLNSLAIGPWQYSY